MVKARVASKDFLSKLAKLSNGGHEHRMGAVLEQHGLQAKIQTSLVDIGLNLLILFYEYRIFSQPCPMPTRSTKCFFTGTIGMSSGGFGNDTAYSDLVIPYIMITMTIWSFVFQCSYIAMKVPGQRRRA